jgi:hypothetical protein
VPRNKIDDLFDGLVKVTNAKEVDPDTHTPTDEMFIGTWKGATVSLSRNFASEFKGRRHPIRYRGDHTHVIYVVLGFGKPFGGADDEKATGGVATMAMDNGIDDWDPSGFGSTVEPQHAFMYQVIWAQPGKGSYNGRIVTDIYGGKSRLGAYERDGLWYAFPELPQDLLDTLFRYKSKMSQPKVSLPVDEPHDWISPSLQLDFVREEREKSKAYQEFWKNPIGH